MDTRTLRWELVRIAAGIKADEVLLLNPRPSIILGTDGCHAHLQSAPGKDCRLLMGHLETAAGSRSRPASFLGSAWGGEGSPCTPSSLPHRPVVTGMDEQGGRLARIEPAQLVLPRAEGHLREFRPKEYRSHCIVPAVGGGGVLARVLHEPHALPSLPASPRRGRHRRGASSRLVLVPPQWSPCDF
jgi:hypothetical protein